MRTDSVSEMLYMNKVTVLTFCDTPRLETFRSILTWRSHTLTWPPRQPDARIWLEEGWKAIHHGVRGWPDSVLTFFPVFRSVTCMLWFPCVEATFVLRHKNMTCFTHTHIPSISFLDASKPGTNSERNIRQLHSVKQGYRCFRGTCLRHPQRIFSTSRSKHNDPQICSVL